MSHRVTSLDQKSPRGLHKTRRCGSGREHIERCDRKKPPRPVTWRAKTEREGFEPPSPFGRSLSRRVQYHSASAPNSKARLPEGRPGGSLRASSSNSAFESGRYQKTAASGGTTNRGARIRTGDLCDPNAALYRTEPRPDFHPHRPNTFLRKRVGADLRKADCFKRMGWDSNPRGY